MPAKLLNSFADENRELEKQIGCMTGILQMFDRHHLVTGRRLSGHSHKKLTSGRALSNNGNFGGEHNTHSKQFVLEKNLSNSCLKEISTQASYSSSPCSSFSSLDCNKSTQQDSTSFHGSTIPERPLTNSPRLKISELGSVHNSRQPCHDLRDASPKSQSLDFRDLVKDSIYRDTRGLSTKEVTKHLPKHRDSPRPMQLSKSMNGHYVVAVNGKPRMCDDLNQSLKVLAKLREAPWNSLEPPRKPYEAKDDAFCSRGAAQSSSNGREVSRRSIDSRENIKSDTKLEELPRLSLDSREDSLRSSILHNRANSLLKDLDRSEMSQRASTSVVAKLMGLEAMPNLSSASHQRMSLMRTNSKKECDPFSGQKHSGMFSKTSRPTQDSQDDKLLGSPKRLFKDSVMQSVLKPNSSTRFPIEAVPWKQKDILHVPQKAEVRHRPEAHVKRQRELVSSEIEKRLKELEFRNPNKDLRALKQLLDAMQAKGLLEAKRCEGQQHKVSRQKNHSDQKNPHPMHVLVKEQKPIRAYDSEIVLMKPTKSIDTIGVTASLDLRSKSLHNLQRLQSSNAMDRRKACTNSRMTNDHGSNTILEDQVIPSTGMKCKENNSEKTRLQLLQSSARPQPSVVESNGSSVRTSSSQSPRLQQRKLELEQKHSHPISSSDSDKPRRQSATKQSLDSVSPRCKLRLKPAQAQKSAGQYEEIPQKHDSSKRATELDVEVTRNKCSESPSGKAALSAASVVEQKKSLSNLKEDVSAVDLPTITPEQQPSPISVLDASFYTDDLPPSPVMKNLNAFKASADNDTQAPDDCWTLANLPEIPQSTLSSEINHKKLGGIDNLVQNHWKLTSTNDEHHITEQTTSCEFQNPDHRYISEILVASHLLLKDFTLGPMNPRALQLHPSGHPINPDLFLVLEQTKQCLSSNPDPKKLHRKLVFDLVNEILVQKLELTTLSPCPELFLRTRRTKDFSRGQHLLQELCSEIELRLQTEKSKGDSFNDENLMSAEDALRQSKWWEDFGGEVPDVVLEIERSIFKDLIDETLCGEAAACLQPKPNRLRRQLFKQRN